MLLVRFHLAHVDDIPPGWVPRILVQCGIPYAEIWDVLHQMYDSQVRRSLCSTAPILILSFKYAGTSIQHTVCGTDHLVGHLHSPAGLGRHGEAESV